jgi:hypothetical protein
MEELTEEFEIRCFVAKLDIQLCEFELEEQREATGNVTAPKWSPETAGDMTEHGRTVVHDVSSVHDARRRYEGS